LDADAKTAAANQGENRIALSRRDFLRCGIAAAAAPVFGWAFDDPGSFVGVPIFNEILGRAQAEHWSRLPIGEIVGRVGIALVGTPYVASTLELYDDREVCSVNLNGLDCVTFYEISLGFARMLLHGGRAPKDLLREITFTRYRGGKLDGYLSRLHYTSDWIEDNDAKGVVRNLTPALPGAIRMDKRIDFMSTHPNAYRQLRANPGLVPRMAALETKISSRKPWYVPNASVSAAEPLLQTGDIVGIATSAGGLDCSHTGLVYVDNSGTRRFLNASSAKGQVVLGERLSEYAANYRRNIGVMIARPK